jgi:hypothetical protein
MQGKLIGSEWLPPGDNPEAVARKILREKRSPSSNGQIGKAQSEQTKGRLIVSQRAGRHYAEHHYFAYRSGWPVGAGCACTGQATNVASPAWCLSPEDARAQARQRLDDQREAMREVIARTVIESHARTILARDDAEAVVLDFVQPFAAGGQFIGFAWKLRREEPGRKGTLRHAR